MKWKAVAGITGDDHSIGRVLKYSCNSVVALLAACFLCLALVGCDREPVAAAPATPPNVMINGQVFIVTKGGANFKLGLVNVSIKDSESVEADKKTFAEFVNSELEKAKKSIDAEMPGYLAAKARSDKAESEYDNAKQALQKALEDHGVSPYSDSDTVRGVDSSEAARIVSLDKAMVAAGIKVESFYKDAISRSESLTKSLSNQRYWVDKGASSFISYFIGLKYTKTDADGKFSFSVPAGSNYVIMASASRSVGDQTERYDWIVQVNAAEATQGSPVLLGNDNLVDRVPGLQLDTNLVVPGELANLPLKSFRTKPTSYIFKSKTGEDVAPAATQTGGDSNAGTVSSVPDGPK